jgi:hypothetical protein
LTIFGPPPQEEEGCSMEQEPARCRSDGPMAMPGFEMNRLGNERFLYRRHKKEEVGEQNRSLQM